MAIRIINNAMLRLELKKRTAIKSLFREKLEGADFIWRKVG